ncbi:GerMN domain-containing protein [Paenibacillus tarimensis]|uniref:GerMN domain-containing protein n=1 Tax=Paenibacillus tarimensis TaxID=416012 RepID=UPI001F2ADFDC|nr:GerMN domain-containing protein [Paenibacillus tarimensis]MCF2943913.1 GerMN domain-containing protein [Paenibacillus tarimensis]
MIRTGGWKRRAALGVLTIPLLTAGCGLLPGQSAEQIDPPVVQYNMGNEEAAQAGAALADTAAKQGGQQLTVYLKDSADYLAPVTLTADPAEEAGEAGRIALEMMVEDGPHAGELPAGFRGILPKGTGVSSVHIDAKQKLATVDFTKPFTDYSLQDERKIVEAITWTLTGIAGVEQVEILHEGEKLAEMPVDGYPLSKPLTRQIGINLEVGPGVEHSQSMPVTLYFSALSEDNKQYYVPVTRLVDRSEEPAREVLQQLISGPLDTRELNYVMTSDVEVKSISLKGDTVTVELNEETYEEGQQLPAEMLQAVVLSVTENTGAAKVLIRVNGLSDVVDTNNRSYAEPVGRPDFVNALKA